MTFEESFAKLEEIKTKLENPETSFDEALGGRIYEKSKSNKVLLKRGQGRNYRYQKEE